MSKEIKERINFYLEQHAHYVESYNKTGSIPDLQWTNFYAEQICKLRKFLDNQLIISIGTENDPEILKIALKTKELQHDIEDLKNTVENLKYQLNYRDALYK